MQYDVSFICSQKILTDFTFWSSHIISDIHWSSRSKCRLLDGHLQKIHNVLTSSRSAMKLTNPTSRLPRALFILPEKSGRCKDWQVCTWQMTNNAADHQQLPTDQAEGGLQRLDNVAVQWLKKHGLRMHMTTTSPWESFTCCIITNTKIYSPRCRKKLSTAGHTSWKFSGCLWTSGCFQDGRFHPTSDLVARPRYCGVGYQFQLRQSARNAIHLHLLPYCASEYSRIERMRTRAAYATNAFV